jgi:hypothetical protein
MAIELNVDAKPKAKAPKKNPQVYPQLPHVHAELIKAWADGAQIEYYSKLFDKWILCVGDVKPMWEVGAQYRIAVPKKPDVLHLLNMGNVTLTNGKQWVSQFEGTPNLKLIFDGETNKLISAELI